MDSCHNNNSKVVGSKGSLNILKKSENCYTSIKTAGGWLLVTLMIGCVNKLKIARLHCRGLEPGTRFKTKVGLFAACVPTPNTIFSMHEATYLYRVSSGQFS